MKAETAQREGNCLHLSRINCQQPRIRDLDKKIGSSHSLIVGLQLLIEPCRSDEKSRLGWQSKTASSPHFAFIPSASRGTIFWRPWKLAKGNVANGGLLWENIPKMVEKTTQKITAGNRKRNASRMPPQRLDAGHSFLTFLRNVCPKCPNFSE